MSSHDVPHGSPTFLDLPAEIRAWIYHYHFIPLSVRLVKQPRYDFGSPMHIKPYFDRPLPHRLALLSVSSQIRNEALPYISSIPLILEVAYVRARTPRLPRLDMSSLHTSLVHEVTLNFLDFHFAVLNFFPHLKLVNVVPAGEMRCQTLLVDPPDPNANANTNDGRSRSEALRKIWTRDEIYGPEGRGAMAWEMLGVVQSMYEVLSPGDVITTVTDDLASQKADLQWEQFRKWTVEHDFTVRFSIGFKFLKVPMSYSSTGRLMSNRSDNYSVVGGCQTLLPF